MILLIFRITTSGCNIVFNRWTEEIKIIAKYLQLNPFDAALNADEN